MTMIIIFIFFIIMTIMIIITAIMIILTVTTFSFQSSKIILCPYIINLHIVSKLILATYILKTLKLKSCIYLFISASEDSQRLGHTVSIDFSIFVFLELFGVAPVMHLDLFLSELLSSLSETTSLSFSEFSSELFSEVTEIITEFFRL